MKQYFVAEEDEGLYNVFSFADFNENGYLDGHDGEDGYHIDDFDKAYQTNSFQDACRWVDNHTKD